jgi:hypothetical protein
MSNEGNPLLSGEFAGRVACSRVGKPCADTTALGLIGPEARCDQMFVMLDDQSIWQYVGSSTASASAAVVVPADNPTAGRWLISPAGGSGKVATTLTITTTTPLKIAGTTSADLSANRTLSIIAATSSLAGSMSAADKAKEDEIGSSTVTSATAAGATNYGVSKLSVAPASATAPIAVGTNDGRLDYVAGTALTDTATTTVQRAAIRTSFLLAGTMSQGETVTLGTTGAVTGDYIKIIRTSTSAQTCAIVNGGGGGGTLFTMIASKQNWFEARYDGTNWLTQGMGQS